MITLVPTKVNDADANGREALNSAQIAIRTWEAVAELQPAGLTEITRRLALPKSTVQRALTTLSREGWIARPERSPRSWEITTAVFAVASRGIRQTPLPQLAGPFLRTLRDTTRETVHLLTPSGNRLIVIDRLESPQELRMVTRIGSEIALHASASGKAFLAAAEPAAVQEYIRPRLESLTSMTVTDPERLLAELDVTRSRGYSVVVDERELGTSAIGAAITPVAGHPVGSVSLSIPTVRFPRDPDAFGRLVASAAAAIAEEVGRRP